MPKRLEINIPNIEAFARKYPKLVHIETIQTPDFKKIREIMELGVQLDEVLGVYVEEGIIAFNDKETEAQNADAAASDIKPDEAGLVEVPGETSTEVPRALNQQEKAIEATMRTSFADDAYKIPDHLRMAESETVRDFSYRLNMEYRNRKQ